MADHGRPSIIGRILLSLPFASKYWLSRLQDYYSNTIAISCNVDETRSRVCNIFENPAVVDKIKPAIRLSWRLFAIGKGQNAARSCFGPLNEAESLDRV